MLQNRSRNGEQVLAMKVEAIREKINQMHQPFAQDLARSIWEVEKFLNMGYKERVHNLKPFQKELREISNSPYIDGNFKNSLKLAVINIYPEPYPVSTKSMKDILGRLDAKSSEAVDNAVAIAAVTLNYLLTHGEEIIKEAQVDQQYSEKFMSDRFLFEALRR